MPRTDLLALTRDDLAAFTNVGTVKRAERELQSGNPSYQLTETPAGELTVTWSDGITCRFPAGQTLSEAICSSGLAGISRHVLRSVMAYQQHCSQATPAAATDETGAIVFAPPAPAVWDPGRITDEQLAARFRASALAKARQRFQRGVLVELSRGVKPLARFLDEPCTLRFLVEGDLRYVTADCTEALLATYVPLAVWAFRELPPDRQAGMISIQQIELARPIELLAEIDARLVELAVDGLAAGPAVRPQQWTRLEARVREAGLVWPAELLSDLLQQFEQYAAHDARFDPLEVVRLTGELLARQRAIASGTSAVPQLLIRGSTNDRTTEIAGGRLIGLGLGVRTARRHVTLSAYLQDAGSGTVVAVERTYADPDVDSGGSGKDYTDLAEVALTRGITLGGIAGAQVLLKAGKRTPSGRLVLPRAGGAMTVNPQAFAWDQLKPPAAIESYSQLAALIESRPPSCLGPRRLADQIYVCPASNVTDVGFESVGQRLMAVLHDQRGDELLLAHPYHHRGREGFEALAHALANKAERVRFVCGNVKMAGRRLQIQPINVVIEEDDRRIGLQPWCARLPANSTAAERGDDRPNSTSEVADPLAVFVDQLQFAISELLLTGLRRCEPRTPQIWRDLVAQAGRLGFVKLLEPIERMQRHLAEKANQTAWDATSPARVLLDLCLTCRVLADLPT